MRRAERDQLVEERLGVVDTYGGIMTFEYMWRRLGGIPGDDSLLLVGRKE